MRPRGACAGDDGPALRSMLAFLLAVLLLLAALLPLSAAPSSRISVFSSGIGGFPCVRVPSLLAIPGGPLLAFAECRSFTGDGCEPQDGGMANHTLSNDVKDRVVCMRSSSDRGKSWGLLHANVSQGRACYPTAVYEPRTKTVLLQFSAWPARGQSSHDVNYYNPSPMQVTSTDNGESFSTPKLVFPDDPPLSIFLGSCRGTVLTAGAHRGRVLFAGYNHSLPKDTVSNTFVWYSDGNGRHGTWRLSSAHVEYMAEPQISSTASGAEVALFGRSNGQMKCRCQNAAWSKDGGAQWSHASNLSSLPSPGCQGSVLMLQQPSTSSVVDKQVGVVGYYSGPDSGSARVNMTVWATWAASAKRWTAAHRIATDSSESGSYSCLEDLTGLSSTHAAPASIGLLWETTLWHDTAQGVKCVGGGCDIVFTYF